MHCYALSGGNQYLAEKLFRKAQANHLQNVSARVTIDPTDARLD